MKTKKLKNIPKKRTSKKVSSKKILLEKKVSPKKKKPIKLHKERFVLEVHGYNRTKVVGKAFKVEHYNKDGSYSRWGVSRKHHRFSERIYVFDSYNKIDKVFNRAKRLSSAERITTMKSFYYQGRFDKATKKVTGIKATSQTYNVGKKLKKVAKKKPKFFTTDVNEIKKALLLFATDYSIEVGLDEAEYEEFILELG